MWKTMPPPMKGIRIGSMPTLAEVYLIDVLQNIKVAEVKKILEGSWYWSARASSAVQFMDPRVGNTNSFNALHSSVRCVRVLNSKIEML